jgi:hypothetical protein
VQYLKQTELEHSKNEEEENRSFEVRTTKEQQRFWTLKEGNESESKTSSDPWSKNVKEEIEAAPKHSNRPKSRKVTLHLFFFVGLSMDLGFCIHSPWKND